MMPLRVIAMESLRWIEDPMIATARRSRSCVRCWGAQYYGRGEHGGHTDIDGAVRGWPASPRRRLWSPRSTWFPSLENAPRPCIGHDRTPILVGVLAGQRAVTVDDLDTRDHQDGDLADVLREVRRTCGGPSGDTRGCALLGFPFHWRVRLIRAMRLRPRFLRPRWPPPRRVGSAPLQ